MIAVLMAWLVQTVPRWRAEAFIARWSAQLRKCGSIRAVKALPDADWVYTRKLPSGEWVAAASEHSCCAGAGFDATVFWDSTGRLQCDTSYSFCGGPAGELDRVEARSLREFYARLPSLRLQSR